MFNDPSNRELDRIALLESRDLILKAFNALHQRELSAGKASEILSHLSQGKSYNQSAGKSDEIVRPLLQYYSNLAYSKATVLLISPRYRESALPASHGLSASGWKEHLTRGGSFLDAKIKVTSGAFSVFGEVTKNKKFIELFLPDGKILPIPVEGSSSYPDNFEFTVGDILSRIPNLSKLYESILEKSASNWMCNIRDYSDTWDLTLTENLLGLPCKERVAELFSVSDINQIEEITTNYMGSGPTAEIRVNLKTSDPEFIRPYLENLVGINGFSYLVEPIRNGIQLSYPSLLFACSYILGMLVRYYPTYWNSILQHEKGDELWPLLKAASNETMAFPSCITEYF